MPLEGQLISLQFRLLRAERAFLDPELQAGKIQPAEAMKVLTQDGVFSVPFANQEVERYIPSAHPVKPIPTSMDTPSCCS